MWFALCQIYRKAPNQPGERGGIGNAPIRSFPPLAHPSSCIFKQCCHRAVQGKGRALSHRPRPLSAPWLKYISPFTQPSFKKLSLTPTTDLVVEFKDFQPEARHPPFVRFGCAIQTQICPGFQGAAALPPSPLPTIWEAAIWEHPLAKRRDTLSFPRRFSSSLHWNCVSRWKSSSSWQAATQSVFFFPIKTPEE